MFGEFVGNERQCNGSCINSYIQSQLMESLRGGMSPATRRIEATPTSSRWDKLEPSSSLEEISVLNESLLDPGFTTALYSLIDLSQI